MSGGIGHNNGPTMEAGFGWRKHVWTKARAQLLPSLPIEIVRLRVKRAEALGLPYKTYASVRASTGQDVIGFLFSSNALRLLRQTDRLSADLSEKIATLQDCDRTALLRPAIAAATVIPPCDAAQPGPAPHLSWSAMRDHLRGVLRSRGRAGDSYLLIGATDEERSWAEAAKTAGFLQAERYFDARP